VRAQVLLSLLVVAGCSSPAAREPLPVEVSPGEALPLSKTPLEPPALADEAARSVVYIERDAHAIKTFRDYTHDVAQSFVNMLVSPITAPLFVFEVFFGWLDFSTTWGSGFVVDRAGHIITNAHVVGTEDELSVERADGVKGRAVVVALDEDRDLALLRVKLERGTLLAADEVLPLGSSSVVRLGEKVVLYGFPNRPWQQEHPIPTVTAGVVSSLGVDVGEAAKRIQLDAAANHGSSGCPVLDVHGAAIGVVTEAADSFESETFAIPIDDVKKAFFEKPTVTDGGGRDGHPH
jgi:S1-C subfamily serine protease